MKGLFFACLALSASAAAAPGIKPLAPSSKWSVDYARDMCVLLRTFGEGPDKVTIGFKPSPMSDQLELMVIKAAGGNARPAIGKANVGFGGAAPPIQASFMSTISKGLALVRLDLSRSELEPLRAMAPLAISVGNRVNIVVDPQQFAAAMEALAACERDLLKSWGMDEAALAAVATHPRPIRRFDANDYPDDALRMGHVGINAARLAVAADGSVTECRVIEPSGVPSLDRQTCVSLVKRGYQPARDAAGKPLSSVTFVRVTWLIEDASGYDYVDASPPAPMPAAD